MSLCEGAEEGMHDKAEAFKALGPEIYLEE